MKGAPINLQINAVVSMNATFHVEKSGNILS